MLRSTIAALLLVAGAALAQTPAPQPAAAQPAAAQPAAAQPAAAQYRAYWVDTFHTGLGTHAAIDSVVAAASRSNANAIFAQVRRRGDAWYLDAREPLTEAENVGEPNADGKPTFDPLRYLIDQAHARDIEVHAFTIVGAIFNGDPRKGIPRDPTHPFVQHVNGIPASSPQQWATRALPPRLGGITYDGQRFGTDWYVDLGHPAAAAYTVDVLSHLVKKYDLDGLHLDRVRYPDSPVQQGGGANVGYNATSVARFRERVGDTADYDANGFPLANDPQWNDWRREQVTAFVRRLYLTVKSIRPTVKVSVAAICYGSGPTASGGFEHTDAYSAVFQDWRGWAEEGIVDILAPMDYKRERLPAQAKQFDDWMRFTANTARANGRISLIGIGAFMNPFDGTLQQTKRALAHSDGVIFYSFASTGSLRNETDDFFAAVGARAFRSRAAAPQLVERGGHLMGLVRDAQGRPIDGADVAIASLSGGETRETTADGNGFYGAPHLAPGRYRATASVGGQQLATSLITIEQGVVTVGDLAQYTIRPATSAK